MLFSLTTTEHTDKIQLVNKINQIKENTELDTNLREIAKDIRCDVLTCIGNLGVGHIGGCLSVVELLTVLYFETMRIDPKEPKKPGRDRFICSKGHAGPRCTQRSRTAATSTRRNC